MAPRAVEGAAEVPRAVQQTCACDHAGEVHGCHWDENRLLPPVASFETNTWKQPCPLSLAHALT